VTGEPEPTISWVVPSPDVVYTVKNDSITLPSISGAYIGIYKCIASTHFENVSKNYELRLNS